MMPSVCEHALCVCECAGGVRLRCKTMFIFLFLSCFQPKIGNLHFKSELQAHNLSSPHYHVVEFQ